ncbi:MAG: acetyl-CoA acetyltransferase [Deltaproteobacteria bacterium RIFOXYA12_FULL_58_15]|nr:MAG: acetyl-CoA acetyltransferase [Deltaproteobacteria bacterium RIFOXYA12_FULL_58_15]
MNVGIVSGVRTAVGRAKKGTLINNRPDDMAALVINEAVKRVKGLEPKDVGDVILGCAMPEGTQGMNIARVAVLAAGWPTSVTAETINRFCSSGLQAIVHGAQEIQCGQEEVVVAGGVESASTVPMGGHVISLNPKLSDEYPEAYIPMGLSSERVAKRFDVTREQQDQYALNSHMKAVAAIEAGKFKDEIVPVKVRVFKNGKLEESVFDTDECPRGDTKLEVLSKLKPAFAATGTTTPGNSSPINDGAAAVVLMSDAEMKKRGLKPIARLRAFKVVGTDPDIMGIGPVPAIRALLESTGLKKEDIGLFEINEAFASQAAYCQRELGLDANKVNVNGGAIALGHPLGATGAKLTVSIINEMKRRKVKYGVVSMCIGGGMGAAGLYENPDA